ncbi:hypothetical protein [Streptomyces sp. NPDC012510]|uniref:hypothetical protein n=1 Tax=Streptomyces sp. NPDC012510 TaxID=3364838 RepID=UPI0036E38DE7
MPALVPTPSRADAHRHQAAADFLQQLPTPWGLGPVQAHRLAPELLEHCDRTGRRLDGRLRRHLTAHPEGIRAHAAVLTTRIRSLRAPGAPRTPAPRPPCSRCGSLRSLVHGRTVCVACITAPAAPPATDPSRSAADARAALRAARAAS